MPLRLKLELNGTDLLAPGRANLTSVRLKPAGQGRALSTAEFEVSVSGGGGLTIVGFQEVRFYEYNTTNGLITYPWFGGYVTRVRTFARGRNRVWRLTCVGYDLQLDALDVDAVTDAGTSISVISTTFANQIAAVTAAVQTFGGGTPSVIFDLSAIPNWLSGTPLPARSWGNVTLRTIYEDICAALRVVAPAMFPRFSIQPANSTSWGPPQVRFWDAADTGTTPVLRINIEAPNGTTTFPAIAVKDRDRDYTQLRSGTNGEGAFNFRTRRTDLTAILTYPNPCSARSQWGGAPVKNTQWITQAQVDNGTQALLDSKKAPRETLQIGTYQRVRPGDFVEITDTLEGLAAVIYVVAEVAVDFSNPNRPYLLLTLGQRYLRLGDSEDGVLVVVDTNDLIGPDPPTAFALTDTPAGTYHGATHNDSATFQWTAPLAADTAGYYVRIFYGGHLYQSPFIPIGEVQYTFPGLPIGTSCTATIFAVDFRNNRGGESTPVSFTSAAADAPGPPTSLTYTTSYRGGGFSEILVTWVAGTGGGTRAYYLFTVTAPRGISVVYRVDGAATSAAFKVTPGLTYSITGTAYTAYDDYGATSATLSATAARAVVSDRDALWHPGQKDTDTSDTLGLLGYSRGTRVGTRVTASVSTAVAYGGIAAFRFLVTGGGAGDSDSIQTTFTKVVTPGQLLTIRFREGDASAATGTLALILTYQDKAGAAVGSPVTAYSAAPSTTTGGTLHEVQVLVPSTITIAQLAWIWTFTTAGTSIGLYVSEAQIGPSAKRADVADSAIGPAQIAPGTIECPPNGSMEVPSQDGTLPAGFTSTGTVLYGSALSIGAGDGQYACQLGTATGTHTLVTPLVQWTKGRGYSGRVAWLEYSSVIGAALVVTITARWYNAAGTYLSSTTLTRETTPSAGAWTANTATWDGVAIPVNTAFVAVQFQAVTSSSVPYYGVDAVEFANIGRVGVLNATELRLGSGALIGQVTVQGNDLQTTLPSIGWWKLMQGLGLDILAGQFKGATAALTGALSAASATLTGALTAASGLFSGNVTVGNGTSSGTVQNTGSGGSGELVLTGSGDQYGSTEIHLGNRSGQNGPLFFTSFYDTSIRLIDFVFKWTTPSGTDQRNIRIEDRSAYVFTGSNPEFQFGTHDDPDFCTSAGGARVRRGILTLAGHLITGGSTPSIAAGTGAGTGPTISISGNDMTGKISLTTGTTPTLAAVIATITFASAFGSTPKSVQLTAANANAAAAMLNLYADDATLSTTLWKLVNQGAALGAGKAFIWYYVVHG